MIDEILGMLRLDGWENATTGVGTSRDKTQALAWLPEGPMDAAKCSSLFHFDPIFQRIGRARVDAAFREGYTVSVSGDAATSGDGEGEKRIGYLAEMIGAPALLHSAELWARVYGGAAIVLGLDDGGRPDQALVHERIRGILWAKVLDRRFLVVTKYYDQVSAGTRIDLIGKPELYMLTGLNLPPMYVHATRVIPFVGVECDEVLSRSIGGWGLSNLQLPFDAIRSYIGTIGATQTLVSDASQAVFKIKNLWESLSGPNKKKLQQRMQLVDLTRSTLRAVLLDTDGEDFKREATNFSGLPDLLDRFMYHVCAATDAPATVIFGRSPAGLNATGDSDLTIWYDSIKSETQTVKLTPRVLRLYRILARIAGVDPARVGVKWAPLSQPSDKERAETRKIVADTDKVMIDAGVLDPLEVRIARYGGTDYDGFSLQIDAAAARQELAATAYTAPTVAPAAVDPATVEP